MIRKLPCSRCANQPASLPVTTTPATTNTTSLVAFNSNKGGEE